MLIKKAKYKKVKVWQKRQISPDVHGCDCCKKEIKEWPNEASRLELTVFNNEHDTQSERYHFCSWSCVLKFVSTVKCNYFISLPHLYFDAGVKERTAKELIKLIKKIK